MTTIFLKNAIGLLESTEIETDQGLININKIIPFLNTIDNKEVIGLTKIHGKEFEFIICIEKDAFDENIPNKDTYLTHNCRIKYNNKIVEISNFITENLNEKIHRIKYNNEVLYHILVKKQNKFINMNNLIIEMLQPNYILNKNINL